MTKEININCDLGEKSQHHSNEHDPDLLEWCFDFSPKSQFILISIVMIVKYNMA